LLSLPASIDLNLQPSPPWGRGWPATGAFSSRGGTGEGVKTVAHNPALTPCDHVGADPLTHRLAVPPLPQGGEGRRIFRDCALLESFTAPRGRGKKNPWFWCCIHDSRRRSTVDQLRSPLIWTAAVADPRSSSGCHYILQNSIGKNQSESLRFFADLSCQLFNFFEAVPDLEGKDIDVRLVQFLAEFLGQGGQFCRVAFRLFKVGVHNT